MRVETPIPTKSDEQLKSLYESYHNLPQNFLSRFGYNQNYLEAATEGFHDALQQYDPSKGTLVGYSFTIMRNTVVNEVRSITQRGKVQTVPLNNALQLAIEDPMLDVENKVDTQIKKTVLLKLIDQLPPAQKRVVQLTFFGGFTLLATSKILGIPEGTVKSRIRLALKKLRVHPVMETLKP